MKALCWHGKNDVCVDDVPEPKIINQIFTYIIITMQFDDI